VVAHQNANAILAHLAGNLSQYDVIAVVEPDFEEGVGLFVNYQSLGGNQVFLRQ
jgi:hypothetical protein